MAVFMLFAPASALIGYFVGGWLNELYGWRTMFRAPGVSRNYPCGNRESQFARAATATWFYWRASGSIKYDVEAARLQ